MMRPASDRHSPVSPINETPPRRNSAVSSLHGDYPTQTQSQSHHKATGCAHRLIERIMAWRWWRWIVMRLPYPMAMILSIGGVMVGMTGPPSDLFFISIGDVKAGALGYCRGTECTSKVPYDLDPAASGFQRTTYMEVCLLAISLGGLISFLIFTYLLIRYLLGLYRLRQFDRPGNDTNPNHKNAYVETRSNQAALDRARFTKTLTVVSGWHVLVSAVLDGWLWSYKGETKGETGKTVWYLVAFTALFWPFVRIFYTHQEAEAKEQLERVKATGRKIGKKARDTVQEAKEKRAERTANMV